MVLAAMLSALVSALAGAVALTAPASYGETPGMLESADQISAMALRQAIGAPLRVSIADQATVRLQESLFAVPKDPAARLLAVSNRPVPPNFAVLLLGANGMDAPGMVAFVPAGFVSADEAMSWSPDDMLASLNDTVEAANAARVGKNLEPREARRWIASPRYDPATHQLSWAALIVAKSAPWGADGEITYHAIGFGRDGYVELSVVTSVQKAEEVGHMAALFLGGLNFLPGKGYGDRQPSDSRSMTGLAGAMGLDSLHKAEVHGNFWTSDILVGVVGSVVAAIGALGMVITIHRHMKRLRRRV